MSFRGSVDIIDKTDESRTHAQSNGDFIYSDFKEFAGLARAALKD